MSSKPPIASRLHRKIPLKVRTWSGSNQRGGKGVGSRRGQRWVPLRAWVTDPTAGGRVAELGLRYPKPTTLPDGDYPKKQ